MGVIAGAVNLGRGSYFADKILLAWNSGQIYRGIADAAPMISLLETMNAKSPEKRPYERPEVKQLGAFGTLTRGLPGEGFDLSPFHHRHRHHRKHHHHGKDCFS
jgi:hypothetical protein